MRRRSVIFDLPAPTLSHEDADRARVAISPHGFEQVR